MLRTSSQSQVRDLARDFCVAEIAPFASAWTEADAFPPKLLTQMASSSSSA
jgi:Acyl-CoA dehydrogenase, N-terminal domain